MWQYRHLLLANKKLVAAAAASCTCAGFLGSSSEPALALPRGAFDDEKLRLAAIARRSAELELRGLGAELSAGHGRHRAALKDAADRRDRRAFEAAQAQLEKYDAQMRDRVEGIMYPGLPRGTRQAYLERHGCAAWTEEALVAVDLASAPRGVIELGAGAGHWATGPDGG